VLQQARLPAVVLLLLRAVHREHWPEEALSLRQVVRLWLAVAALSPV
jgi:hypothetical protein